MDWSFWIYSLGVMAVLALCCWVFRTSAGDKLEEGLLMGFPCQLFGGPQDGLQVNLVAHPSEVGDLKLPNKVHPSGEHIYRWDSVRRRLQYVPPKEWRSLPPGTDCERGEGKRKRPSC